MVTTVCIELVTSDGLAISRLVELGSMCDLGI